MKKILFLFVVFSFLTVQAKAEDLLRYCPASPYPVGGAVARSISNATGMNFLLTKLVEVSLQKQLKKEMKSNFNVELYAFGGKNLIDGKFKKLEVSAKKIKSDDVNMHNFKAESLCGYNRVVLKDDLVYFDENFLMEYSGEITSDDFKNTILSKKNLDAINKVNINILGTNVFKIYEPSAKIENNRIYMTIKMAVSNLLITKRFNLKTDFALKVEDGKILFTDINIGDTCGINANTFLPIINVLNPFRLKVKIDDVNVAKIYTKQVKIENNTIYINGNLLIPASI